MTTVPEEAVKAAKDVLYYANPNDVERALTAAAPHLAAVQVNSAKIEAARKAVEQLANVQMDLSLSDWSRLSSAILSALEPSGCKTCNGRGIIGGMYRVGDGDVDAWEEPCPECEPSVALGWIYFNEDAGTEFSVNHPIESGECPDAQDIRPATAENLRDEMLRCWKAWAEDREELDRLRDEPSAAQVQVSGNSGQLKSAPDMVNPITLTYTNYRGVTSERTITPIRSWYGSTEWHPEPQWMLTAFDHEKQANRDFALKDFGWPQPKVEKGETFKGTVDGDTELQAAARHAGWALIELVDEIDWLKREQVSDIITRLGIALNEPSDGVDTIEVGNPATELSTASTMEVVADLPELLERLDAGLEYEGELETENDHIELFNVEAAQDLFADAAAAIRTLSSPDHADAGKVEGNGNRWRIFEAACARGYWGIELEQASNDDEPILYPIKVHRDTLVRIVEAHNFPLPSAPSQEVA